MEAARQAEDEYSRQNLKAQAASAIAERKVCVAKLRKRLNIPVEEEEPAGERPAST
jgi:hypothetical protein